MAVHAEDALGCSGIAKVFYFPLAVATFETIRAESLITRQNSQIFYLVVAVAAAICAIVADERTVAEEEEIGIGV